MFHRITRASTLASLIATFLAAGVPGLGAAPEALEVGPAQRDQLPRGKEADGILGDFILRNHRVEAVIAGNLPLRRANMSTFYNAITPGCLYDLTLRGASNDQITVFCPAGQQGAVSFVRLVADGRGGEAAIETVVSSANNNGLFKRHEYRLKDDWQGLLVVTTLRNEDKKALKADTADRWTTFTRSGTARGIAWADAVDPADKAGYARGWIERDGLKAPASTNITLQPGEEISFARFLAVGTSPAEAFGLVAAQRGPTGRVSGRIEEHDGAPVTTARLAILFDPAPAAKTNATNLVAYPDARGRFDFRLPPGDYPLELSDLGRPTLTTNITVTADGEVALTFQMEPAAAITFDIRDEQGRSLPCKAQFLGIEGTKSPNLGPANRAHGCLDQYHSERGQFRVAVPPGTYKVVVTRGIEYSHLVQTARVAAASTVAVRGTLRRLVDTTAWVSCDFHNHSTPSGDNTCGTDDRIINLAAEHVEFAPTTEHNRLYDWTPHIQKLGLTNDVATVPGLELTGTNQHFNAFPFTPKPHTQDWGAPVWENDPRVDAIRLRDHQGFDPDRWVQINHPDMVHCFIDRDGDGRMDGGYLGLGQMIDGLETENGNSALILFGAPFRVAYDRRAKKEIVRYVTEFIWLQLLNRGARYWGVAVCDAHAVHGNGVGGWRMYVPSSTDEPAEIDWREISRHSKVGHSVLTAGPFLDVRTADGAWPGADVRAPHAITLRVKVQCTDWIDIDRVQVLVNGRPRPDLNFTRKTHADWFQNGVVKFERALKVPLSEDSHLIVVAIGEQFDLATGYGSSSQAKFKPCAYNNPIFVDVDGGGFRPNGDLLDWPLPVKKLTVDDVRQALTRRAIASEVDQLE